MATPFDDYDSSDQSEDETFVPQAPPPSVVICTYAFTGDEDIEYVLENLMKGCPNGRPDVVALQNICKLDYVKVLRFLKKQGYFYVLREETKSADYGEMLFSKLQILSTNYFLFSKTCQTRGVIAYQLNVTSNQPMGIRGSDQKFDPIWVCTSQLEDDSSAGASFRKQQIQELDRIFTYDPKVIFAGDTCITTYQSGTHKAPTGWLDAWREKGTKDEELTYRLDPSDPNTGDRRDQIWVKGLEIKEFGIAYDDDRSGVYAVVGM